MYCGEVVSGTLKTVSGHGVPARLGLWDERAVFTERSPTSLGSDERSREPLATVNIPSSRIGDRHCCIPAYYCSVSHLSIWTKKDA